MTYLNLEPFYSLPVKKYRLCVIILEAIENRSAQKSTEKSRDYIKEGYN